MTKVEEATQGAIIAAMFLLGAFLICAPLR
jgi:hypothetical protein